MDDESSVYSSSDDDDGADGDNHRDAKPKAVPGGARGTTPFNAFTPFQAFVC